MNPAAAISLPSPTVTQPFTSVEMKPVLRNTCFVHAHVELSACVKEYGNVRSMSSDSVSAQKSIMKLTARTHALCPKPESEH